MAHFIQILIHVIRTDLLFILGRYRVPEYFSSMSESKWYKIFGVAHIFLFYKLNKLYLNISIHFYVPECLWHYSLLSSCTIHYTEIRSSLTNEHSLNSKLAQGIASLQLTVYVCGKCIHNCFIG